MRILFDASALINLSNSGLLEIVLDLTGRIWFVGAIVVSECEERNGLPANIRDAIDSGRIQVLDDTEVSGSQFLGFLNKHRLGEGETECLSYGSLSDYIICCDDRRARTMIGSELGADRLTGSLGLLRELVQQELFTIDDAFAGYQRIILSGGFLPNVNKDFFR